MTEQKCKHCDKSIELYKGNWNEHSGATYCRSGPNYYHEPAEPPVAESDPLGDFIWDDDHLSKQSAAVIEQGMPIPEGLHKDAQHVIRQLLEHKSYYKEKWRTAEAALEESVMAGFHKIRSTLGIHQEDKGIPKECQRDFYEEVPIPEDLKLAHERALAAGYSKFDWSGGVVADLIERIGRVEAERDQAKAYQIHDNLCLARNEEEMTALQAALSAEQAKVKELEQEVADRKADCERHCFLENEAKVEQLENLDRMRAKFKELKAQLADNQNEVTP